jgi:trimethylamine---corrinoid protein Co-methyltransferase
MTNAGLPGGQYRPLSDGQIETIHQAALTILAKTGIGYEPGLEGIVDMLADAGAAVDREQSRIIFPPEMVLNHVAQTPSRLVLYSRDGCNDLDLGEHRVHLGTGGAAVQILDLDSGLARKPTLNDLYQLGRLVDRLDNIHFLLRPCIPTDIPTSAYDINMFYAGFKSTAKHFVSGVNDPKGLDRVVELAAMLAGSREALQAKPFISISTCFAISPLKLCTQSTRIMQASVRHGIPVILSSAPMAGSTSPISMAGTLAQLHAEQLAGITICQLTRPGALLQYGGIPGMAEMRTMAYLGGAAECGMMNAAIHQLAHHIGVPNYNSAGLTAAKVPDAQAGWEKAQTILLAAMGGSNFIHHAAGMLESMLAVAYEQYVIDDEIIGNALRVLKGIDVDAEHLALEVIHRVGPGGNFMADDHTMDHLLSEYFMGSGIADRKNWEMWAADGAKDARQRAIEKVREILAQSEKSYIPPEIDAAMRDKFDILL